MPKLTEKQRKFVHFYNITQNARKAAELAGYSKNTALHDSWKLLEHVEIKALINRYKNKVLEKFEVTENKIAAELAKIAFSNMNEFANWNESTMSLIPSDDLTGDQTAAISEIQETVNSVGHSLKFKKHDKIKALELLGKWKKMFVEKVDHSNSDGSLKPVYNFTFTEKK